MNKPLDQHQPDEIRITPRPVREEQAWREIGQTEFGPGVRTTLVIGFLGCIVLVPLLQLCLPTTAWRALRGTEGATEPITAAERVEATVAAVSAPPDTGGVYNDFLMQLHLTEVRQDGVDQPDLLVQVPGMRQREVLPTAGLRPGDRIALAPRAWTVVADQFEGMNGSALTDERFTTMPRHFAERVVVRDGAAEPSSRDFLAIWRGRGADLPVAHQQPVGTGAAAAWQKGEGPFDGLLTSNAHLAERITLYEERLDDDAVLALLLKSPVQGLMTMLGVGNEKAYVGRDGWLFYAPGVQSLTGPGFLDHDHLAQRRRTDGPHPDPRPAIVDLHEQLAARNIQLVVMPTPVKPSLHPEQLSGRYNGETRLLRNRSFPALLDDLRAAGVHVYDPAPLLLARKTQAPQFLATDTHWTPAAMEAVAAELATELAATLPTAARPDWQRVAMVHEQVGDIATMLELPTWQTTIAPERVTVHQLRDAAGRPWRPDAQADILLLGDSFSNIYHLGGMGWGSSAGFAAQLAWELGRPVDSLTRNDAGAWASRQLLVDALEQDPHRLIGKRVVVWQFAERELAVGDWPCLALPTVPDQAEPPGPPIPAVTSISEATAAFRAVAEAADQPAVVGREGWLHLTAELRHLGHGPFWGEQAPEPAGDPLRAIVDLHEQLAGLGIDLILAPAPPRAVIYPDRLFPAVPLDARGVPERLDPHLQAFYAELREAGVQVVDLTDTFLAARAEDAELGPVCCPQDTHWSPRGLQIATAAIAAHIGDPDWLMDVDMADLWLQDPEPLAYVGDLVDRVPGHPRTTTSTSIQRVTADAAGSTGLAFDADSPVLLLADSHGLVFSVGGDMHAEAAGLGEHLALELGFAVDRMARRGSGDTVRRDLARRFLTSPAAVAGKRVVIYTFAARTFTEYDSWATVPLTR